jgi:thiamine-phosphate pyrophosphorylase
MLEAGIKVLQYREKDKKAGEMLRECRVIRAMTREAGCCFLVNDYLDIALLCEADGVHLGQDDIPAADARRLLGPERVMGISTHSLSQARAALAGGADYIGVGPIFPTATKTTTPPVGYAYLEEIAAECPLPFVTIGGINERTVSETIRRGARCCAVVSDITSAGDIPAHIGKLRVMIRAARVVE